MFCYVDKTERNFKKFGSYIIHENADRYYLPRLIHRYYDDVKIYKDSKFELKVPKKFKFVSELRESQIEMSQDLFNVIERDGFINGIVHARPGAGKCHGKDTPILMYDGTIKMVQDVVNGDLIMGPDSAPRIVSGVTVGYGKLYKVIPISTGNSFVCNADHILSLVSNNSKCKDLVKDEVINISIKDYLEKNTTFKHCTKLWRTGIDFKSNEVPFDPQIIGAYLGDGTKQKSCSITIAHYEPEIFKEFDCFCKKNNLTFGHVGTKYGARCSTYTIKSKNLKIYTNTFREYIFKECINENNERNIPNEYLINDKNVRLNLLAGLLDTDGHLGHNGYEITCKDEHFADQICFLARSLGFACNKSSKISTIKKLNFSGTYYRIYISGNTDCIPCRLPHKRATERQQIKNHLRTGFNIEEIGDGNYYGFCLNKDHLYLLGDFTVTHNTNLGIYVASKLNLVTLIVIDNKKIVGQQKEEILKHTDLEDSDIGLIKGDIFDVENKVIIVTTPQTLSSRFKNNREEFYPKFRDIGIGFVCWDEIHKIANIWASGSLLFNTPHFIGLSATPFHDKVKSRLMYSLFGEIETTYGEYDFSPVIKFHHYDSGLEKKYGKRVNFMWTKDMNMARSVYNKALLDSSVWANLCVDIMEDELSKNNKIIVIVFTQAQLILLYDLAIERGLKPTKLYSKVNKINKDEDDLVIATQKYASEAFDYPSLNRLIIAVPLLGRKSLIQTIGRILRSCSGKSDAIVHDLIDTGKNFNNIFVETVAVKTNILSQEYDNCTYEKV